LETEPHPFVSACRRHNPHERAVLMEHGPWLALLHPRNSPDYAQRSAAGRLSLQLWNCDEHLSILAPSIETDFAFEVFPVNDEAVRLSCYRGVTDFLDELELAAIPRPIVSDLYARFVLAALICA